MKMHPKLRLKLTLFNYGKKGFLLLLGILLVVFLSGINLLSFNYNLDYQTSASAASGNTIYVDVANCPGPGTGTQADPYCEIQTAIDHTSQGDAISVAAGTYNEHLVMNASHGANDISVVGAAAASTIISGPTVGLNNEKVLIDGMSGITFQNFTVRDGAYGIYIAGGSSTVNIDGAYVVANTTDGVYINSSSGVTVQNSNISNNANIGINNISSSGVTMSNNIVSTNGTGSGPDEGGIINTNSANTVINNNSTISGNLGQGIKSTDAALDPAKRVTVSGCSISSNAQNGIVSDTIYATVYNNVIYSNADDGVDFRNALAAGDVRSTAYNNTIYGNTDDGILVRDADVLLIGNNIGSAGAGNGEGVVVQDVLGVGASAYLYGNQIKYNITNGINIHNLSGAVVLTLNLYIYSNEISDNQVGIYIQETAKGEIKDNLIEENSQGGIAIDTGATGSLIASNMIANNGKISTTDAHGIAIASTADVDIYNNVITGTGGTADANEHSGLVTSSVPAGATYFRVYNNVFDANEDDGYYDDSPDFDILTLNNIFSANGDYGLDGSDRGVDPARATNTYNNYYNNVGGDVRTGASPNNAWTANETGKLTVNPYYMKETTPPSQPPYDPPAQPAYSLQYKSSGYGNYNSGCVDRANPSQTYDDAYRPPARAMLRGDMGAYGGNKIYKNEAPTIVAPTSGTISSDSTPTVTGYVAKVSVNSLEEDASAGNRVRIYKNGAIVGEDTDLEYDATNNRSNFSVTTADLGADGTYTLEARVVNKLGVESFGATVSYTLASSNPVVTIASITPSSIGDGESAALVFRSNTTGTYRVEVGGSGWGTGTLVATDSYSTINQSITISVNSSKLVQGTNTVYVYLKDGANNTGSDSVSLTLDDYPPAAISDLSLSNITSDSAQLTWTAPGGSGLTGQASSYIVKYSLGYITESNWNEAMEISKAPTPAAAGTVQTMKVPTVGAGITGSSQDTDKDGLTDYMEVVMTGSNPYNQDTDGDGYHDGTENFYGYPLLDPRPLKVDSDGDGLIDEKETIKFKTDIHNSDTDGDGYSDLTEINTYYSPLDPRPQHFDTDGDGLDDYIEIEIHHTNHTNRDTDSDGYDDLTEVRSYKYDPVNVFYYAIKAVDSVGNVSGISNIVHSPVF